jgi:hypothetical protein
MRTLFLHKKTLKFYLSVALSAFVHIWTSLHNEPRGLKVGRQLSASWAKLQHLFWESATVDVLHLFHYTDAVTMVTAGISTLFPQQCCIMHALLAYALGILGIELKYRCNSCCIQLRSSNFDVL